jgi:hypothetical protein
LNVDLRGAPPGTTEYSAVSTLSSNGNVCTRSMEITRTGKGEKPKIVSHTSGNCGLAGNAGLGFRPLTVPDDAPAGTTLVNVRQNGLIPPSAVAARGSLQF